MMIEKIVMATNISRIEKPRPVLGASEVPTMVEFLVWLAAAIIVFAVVMYLLKIIPIPAEIEWVRTAVMIVLAAAFLIWLLFSLTGMPGPPPLSRIN